MVNLSLRRGNINLYTMVSRMAGDEPVWVVMLKLKKQTLIGSCTAEIHVTKVPSIDVIEDVIVL